MGGQVGVDDLRGREPRWWRWLAFAVLLLGVVWRASAWLREPLLEFEDGAVLFARCFAEADPGRWFEPYGGYVPIGPNVTAWFACRLPIAAIPFAFVALAVALHAAAAASVLHPDWRSLGSFGQRLVVAASVAWLPVTDHLHFTTLSYVQWGMLRWLVVLMLRPPAGSTAARSGTSRSRPPCKSPPQHRACSCSCAPWGTGLSSSSWSLPWSWCGASWCGA